MYEISYANLMMLLNTIPQYKGIKDDEEKEFPEEVDSIDDLLKLGIK